MKTALLLIALLPGFAHAVNKCSVAGKVMYTDAPCERLGGTTTKTFTPRANMVESQDTADVKRKIASGEMTVTQTRLDANGLRESRTDVGRNSEAYCAGCLPTVSGAIRLSPIAPYILNASAARQPNSAATQEQLAASRRNLHEQRGRNECEKGAGAWA